MISPSRNRMLRFFVFTMLGYGAVTTPQIAGPPSSPSVTATALFRGANANSITVPAGTSVTATLRAQLEHAGHGNSQGISNQGWTWSWTYTVEYAASPGQYSAPPSDAQYSVAVNAPPSTNPSATTLRAQFSTPGYWRITNIKATVTHSSITVSGTASDLDIIAVGVQLSPSPIFVQAGGGTAVLSASITPAAASNLVRFTSTNHSVSTVAGSAPYLTVVGGSAGTSQVDAKVGNYVACTADVNVLDVSYSPQSGPVFTKIAFTTGSQGAAFFSANTTVRVDAVFIPVDDSLSDTFFSVTYDASKILFDPLQPNQIALAVADVFPSTFLTSSNPAIKGSVPGSVFGLATLIDGENQCSLELTFEISSAGTIGKISDGIFQDISDVLPVWQANSADDLVGLDPSVFLFAQIVRPVNEFTAGAPSTMTVQIVSFRPDGREVSSGVSVQFTLISSDASFYTYQNTKPFILIENPMFEGETADLIAITSGNNCYTQLVRLPQ